MTLEQKIIKFCKLRPNEFFWTRCVSQHSMYIRMHSDVVTSFVLSELFKITQDFELTYDEHDFCFNVRIPYDSLFNKLVD